MLAICLGFHVAMTDVAHVQSTQLNERLVFVIAHEDNVCKLIRCLHDSYQLEYEITLYSSLRPVCIAQTQITR